MTARIPSPRQLKLARFERPDFRSAKPARHRVGDWTWSRALYRLRRWMAQAQADVINATHEATRPLVRAMMALKASRPVRRPRLAPEPLLIVRLTADTKPLLLGLSQAARSVGVLRTKLAGQVGRQSTPARLFVRRPGAHRLDQLKHLPSKAYMSALDARNRYVIANLIRLQEFASVRAAGETTWMEARRADHFASA